MRNSFYRASNESSSAATLDLFDDPGYDVRIPLVPTAKQVFHPFAAGRIGRGLCVFGVFIIPSMSLDENSVQTWIYRGKESYWHFHIADAAADFEKAVSIDPQSFKARLRYGVVCSYLYQNGGSAAIPRLPDADADRHWSDTDFHAELHRIRVLIEEQNSTNGKRAEANLRRARQIEPRNKLVMEYLAHLYYSLLDPHTDAFGNKRQSRLVDAEHWYKQIVEIDPEHNFANYMCGVIGWERAFELIRVSGRYPRPLPNEEARRSLHAQVSPLLDEAGRNLLRSLEIDPGNWSAMSYLIQVRHLQAFVAATKDEHSRARSEANGWNRKVNQILESQAKAAGQPWPPGPVATMTFQRVHELRKPPKGSQFHRFRPIHD